MKVSGDEDFTVRLITHPITLQLDAMLIHEQRIGTSHSDSPHSKIYILSDGDKQ